MIDSLEIKENLLKNCHQFCDDRFKTIKQNIEDINITLTNETKSSAGDKHETGRAMLQIEREKQGNQLAEIQKLLQTLSKIDITRKNLNIGLGSVVYTTQANYSIAISAGELIIDNQNFYAISTNTPIGQLLLGKIVNESIEFRGQKISIVSVI